MKVQLSRWTRFTWWVDDVISWPIESLAWKITGRSFGRHSDRHWIEQGIDPKVGRQQQLDKLKANLRQHAEHFAELERRFGEMAQEQAAE